MESINTYLKGRGAQINPHNRFNQQEMVVDVNDILDEEEQLEILQQKQNTKYIEVFPKSIINWVKSPDIPGLYSMNPYQGCEHGCTYCYARPTHEYRGYSAGKEFEQNILIKKNAPQLLRECFEKPNWQSSSIMLSGNTDCYQPAEKKFQITRELLKVCLAFRHPVSIITKNALIARDADVLEQLAALDLVHVTFSLSTLNEDLKRVMEPRTSTAKNVLKTIQLLSEKKIPINVNVAPIIPSINDSEIFDLAKAVSAAGALSIHYIVVRLNDQVEFIFKDWLERNFPDRYQKCIHQIESVHGGSVSDKRTFVRMKGEGNWAEIINKQFKLSQKKYFADKNFPSLDTSIFINDSRRQGKLF